MDARRATLLVVHEDGDVVDLLRGFFDRHSFAVEWSADAMSASRRLEAGNVAVVIVPFEGLLGRLVARWVLERRPELRDRLIVLRRDEPTHRPDIPGRRIAYLDDLPGLLAATNAVLDSFRPRLLLVDDDPAQLYEMAVLLEDAGFGVTTAGGGRAAVALLEEHRFDVILSDWAMPEGDGEVLFRWIAAWRAELLSRLIFMTGGDVEATRRRARDITVLPKGQDSQQLLGCLDRAISRPRFSSCTPAQGVRQFRASTVTGQWAVSQASISERILSDLG